MNLSTLREDNKIFVPLPSLTANFNIIRVLSGVSGDFKEKLYK
jgi:hypothetical protein